MISVFSPQYELRFIYKWSLIPGFSIFCSRTFPKCLLLKLFLLVLDFLAFVEIR